MAPMPNAIKTMLAAIPPYWKSLRISPSLLWLRWLVSAAISAVARVSGIRKSAWRDCGKPATRFGVSPAAPEKPPGTATVDERPRGPRPLDQGVVVDSVNVVVGADVGERLQGGVDRRAGRVVGDRRRRLAVEGQRERAA